MEKGIYLSELQKTTAACKVKKTGDRRFTIVLTQGLNRFIAGTDWSGFGAFIGKRLSDALGALRTAVTQFDWGAAGTALST